MVLGGILLVTFLRAPVRNYPRITGVGKFVLVGILLVTFIRVALRNLKKPVPEYYGVTRGRHLLLAGVLSEIVILRAPVRNEQRRRG